MVKKVVPIENPTETEIQPIKKKGQSEERMAELSIIANQTKKMNAKIKQFEKQNAKQQMIKKYEMIKKLEEEKNTPQQVEQLEKVKEQVEEQEEEQEEQVKPIQQKKEKKKKIVEEVIEVEESDTGSDTDSEEIVIKKVIKRIPRQKQPPTTEELYKLSTTDMLKQRLYNDRVKRVNNDLFDF